MNRSLLHAENLATLFAPQSIAVVGTNNNVGTVPHDIFDNLLKSSFQGTLYPVSPACRAVKCVKAYKYVLDIEDPVDLAVLVFPSHVCHLALEQCGQKGIRSAIVISAGFKETGPAGKQREEQLRDIADRYGMSFIGPNCLGVINTDPAVKLNASFARQMPEEGNICFLSQSGALCTAVLDYAKSKHIGFSKFVSFGNKADVSEIDLLYYLKDDPETKVILLYLEEITDGQGLMAAARTVIEETGKPILLLKSGRTQEGAAAAASHTGSLAGSDEICSAALRQCGIIRCADIEDMFNAAIAFAYQPPPRGRQVAIITNAGGPGVLATDAAVANGLTMSSFESDTTRQLKQYLPKTANINNPVDVIGDARVDRYQFAIENILRDPRVDGVLVILTPQSMTDIEAIAQEISLLAHHSDKPILTSFMGEAEVSRGIEILQRKRIPHYILPESMCRAFTHVCAFQQIRAREKDVPLLFHDIRRETAERVLAHYSPKNGAMLSPLHAQDLLDAYGIPTVPCGVASTPEEAAYLAQSIGCPVAMKIVSDRIVHKVDVQGVRLDVRSAEEAVEAFHAIRSSVLHHASADSIAGVLVQKMVPKGMEMILGMKRDPSFGTVLLFGLGGTFVETFRDISFRVTPLGRRSIQEMLQEVKSYILLKGTRGMPPRDIPALMECLFRFSQLVNDFPRIREMDINPMVVLEEGKGCYSVDTKILL
jgi:acetyltransferase